MIFKTCDADKTARYYPHLFNEYLDDILINNLCGQSIRLPAVVYNQSEVKHDKKYIFISGNGGI